MTEPATGVRGGRVAVFASGNGSNFQAIVEALAGTGHQVVLLVCDRAGAGVLDRAERAGIPIEEIRYRRDTPRDQTETEFLPRLAAYTPDLIALAGFMRLLSPVLIDAYPGRILNIHPSLLPRYPGTRGIEESFAAGDPEGGVTVHLVDYDLDSGPILRQARIPRRAEETLAEFEMRIHALEHSVYPDVILRILTGENPSR